MRKNSVPQTSSEPSFSLADIQKLISQSEERIIKHVNDKFELLTAKMAHLESAITEVKAVQVQQESCLSHIKEIIVEQQSQIEAYEERSRRCNLILSGVPETPVSLDGEEIKDDADKVVSLLNLLSSDDKFSEEDISEMTRIGRGGRPPRILKVRFEDFRTRNDVLRCSRNLNSPAVHKAFGRVYVNKDMSLLRRREEKRLREHYVSQNEVS